MRQASIDLGSNSVLLTVVDDGRVLHDEARVVGLGKGLGDGGEFDPERMEAALNALRDYAATAAKLQVPPAEVLAVATSASRRPFPTSDCPFSLLLRSLWSCSPWTQSTRKSVTMALRIYDRCVLASLLQPRDAIHEKWRHNHSQELSSTCAGVAFAAQGRNP